MALRGNVSSQRPGLVRGDHRQWQRSIQGNSEKHSEGIRNAACQIRLRLLRLLGRLSNRGAVMDDWQLIGPHRYCTQGDVLCFEPHGELSPSQAATWSETIASHFSARPQGFLLIDATTLVPPSAEVRRLFVSFLRNQQPRPRILVFGANLIMRTASRLVLAAARQLYGLELDLTQYATEQEARAQIDGLRQVVPG